MTGLEPSPTPKPDTGIKGRRTRVVMALLVAWALVASIGLGWSLTIQRQQEQSIHTAVGVLVAEMGGALSTASAAGQSFLSYRSLNENWTWAVNQGWIGAVWMHAAAGRVHDLGWVTDGNAVRNSLNLQGLDCVAIRYESIVGWATTNSSLLEGTNKFTLYFGSVVNLTLSLGNELVSLAYATGGDYSQVLDRLNSPTADSTRTDVGALYDAGAGIWSYPCA